MIKSVIYRLTFPNGKLYVGRTVDFLGRMSDHQTRAFNKKDDLHRLPLYNAIRKYGWENIKKDILVDGIPKKLVGKVETVFIRYYKYFLKRKVYNIKDVDNPHSISKKTRQKLSENSWWRGKTGKDHNCSRPVFQINKIMGETIQEWENVQDVKRKLNINPTHIYDVCNGKRKSAGGFIWAYKDSHIKTKIDELVTDFNKPRNFHQYKSILQIDRITGKIIKQWDSLQKASETLKINPHHISEVCSNKRGLKSAGGFVWRYVEQVPA